MIRVLLALAIVCSPALLRVADAQVNIAPDVVYGHKDGLAMTFDVFTPKANAKGIGILFMVSGGWYSGWNPPEKAQAMFAPLTAKGFTVFAVRHGSSPKYGIPDAVSDVRRAVRYIRLNAEQFKVDPQRLGVYGMSAGGHLSLMLGTASDEGDPKSPDPVLKVSDRVQAVVAYVAPTDLTIMVREHKERLPAYDRFPALDLDLANAKLVSPLKQVSEDDAPTLLIVGVKDDLVPVDHSRKIKTAFEEKKVPVKLVEYPNSTHGLLPDDAKDSVVQMAEWFETHLGKK